MLLQGHSIRIGCACRLFVVRRESGLIPLGKDQSQVEYILPALFRVLSAWIWWPCNEVILQLSIIYLTFVASLDPGSNDPGLFAEKESFILYKELFYSETFLVLI